MANTYTWEISQFNAKIQDGDNQNVIYEIIFVYIVSDGEENPTTARQVGVQHVEYNPENPFIPYEDLTKNIVIGWLEATVDIEQLKQDVDELLYQKKNPVDEILYPNWNDPV
jgi:hypothetical protein